MSVWMDGWMGVGSFGVVVLVGVKGRGFDTLPLGNGDGFIRFRLHYINTIL